MPILVELDEKRLVGPEGLNHRADIARAQHETRTGLGQSIAPFAFALVHPPRHPDLHHCRHVCRITHLPSPRTIRAAYPPPGSTAKSLQTLLRRVDPVHAPFSSSILPSTDPFFSIAPKKAGLALRRRRCRQPRHGLRRAPAHPTEPSSDMPINFCVSAMNSIGSCCSTSRTKPLTISATASSSLKPRCRQ